MRKCIDTIVWEDTSAARILTKYKIKFPALSKWLTLFFVCFVVVVVVPLIEVHISFMAVEFLFLTVQKLKRK